MASHRSFGFPRPGIAVLACCSFLAAAEHHGQVRFGGLPVPGATVTAARGDQRFTTISDPQGAYSFAELANGVWTIRIEMQCFAPLEREVAVAPAAPAPVWELNPLPLEKLNSSAPPPKPQAVGETNQAPSDGFLINGSVNNGLASPWAQPAAFGNYRKGPRSLYNGSLGLAFNNSLWDARSFSLTGQNTPKPDYSRVQGMASFGGPLRIPRLGLREGPNVTLNYQWTRNRNATMHTARVPTAAERSGDLSQTPGAAFAMNAIPPSRISPQARALLGFYPLPNFNAGAGYNYQTALVGSSHQDSLQSRANKFIGKKDQVYGAFAFESARGDNTNIFGFLGTTSSLGLNSSVNWTHRFGMRGFSNLGFQFSRQSMRTTPFFAGRLNVSGRAGIAGNNQEPAHWGPPSLVFSSGIAALSDVRNSATHNQTGGISASLFRAHGAHNITAGAGFRRQQFNAWSQQDPRGTFTFTGAAAGSDLAGFLLGIPDTSSIAFGNADKYLRAAACDAHITDDWRFGPSLTFNGGVRWEYGAPITELYGRLVNLDVAPAFSAIAPVVAASPVGPLTGRRYPDSLVNPHRRAFQPRAGLSWRPVLASSLVIRAGYGVYYDTSIHLPIAARMAQQPPLSRSLSVANSAANPLTLADGFRAPPDATTNTFAVDPNFRAGYAQTWQLSIQRDLPSSTVVTATYLGTKGTRAQQQFLPHTWPAGGLSPCPSCPSGYAYLASNGNSTRESGQIQLRRRLGGGWAAQLSYTFSKSIDNAALGDRGQGATVIAQDWRNLSGERGLSSFDQRHLLSAQTQYTSGIGLGGGTLLDGWRGRLTQDWTITAVAGAGSGLPLTPVHMAVVGGTGIIGSVRPDYTGAPLYAAPPGMFLNPAAVASPAPGRWGNAGRNSITGPAQFTLNAGLGRIFRLTERLSADFRLDAVNVLNHVTFPSWNVVSTSAQFGLPAAANPMRHVQASMRVRF
ncbi:MAG: carboxypeptidase regulatory-like domain-containing protein [Acidobacteria bacterium]|nr:carboxypeptidase regulatory-like domain-containing protein [Acidobacteriota bacterium]